MAAGSLPMPINSDLHVEPDYVFTHSELEDVLSFMTGGEEIKPGSLGMSSFLMSSTPPASASLQFQPHLSNPYDSLGLDQGLNGAQPFLTQIGNDPMLPQDAGMPFDMAEHLQPGLNPQPGSKAFRGSQPTIKGEPLGELDTSGMRSPLDVSLAPSPVHVSSAAMDDVSARPSAIRTRNASQGASATETAPLTKAFAQLGSGLSSPPSRPLQSSAEVHNTPYHRKGSKQHTSHSTVEKNRRDRINSLIDELRDLVPPQSKESNSQDNLDPSKRPKHVVLSDTIQLVRMLQSKVLESEKALRQAHSGSRAHSGSGLGRDEALQENGVQNLIRRSLPEGTTFSSDSTTSSSGPSQDLPSAPKGATQSAGVVVEQSSGCLYVKVNCRDRRGLLSDVITALKSIPLEITTAAVTTTADGYVYDVFQVKAPAGQSYTQEDIQCHVHYALYPSSNRDQLGDKRQRTADED